LARETKIAGVDLVATRAQLLRDRDRDRTRLAVVAGVEDEGAWHHHPTLRTACQPHHERSRKRCAWRLEPDEVLSGLTSDERTQLRRLLARALDAIAAK
jgi:hypothetical protein